jgi:phosphoglycerate dehydrogenase-like enzyme
LHNLIILSKNFNDYINWLVVKNLPDLVISEATASPSEINPSLPCDILLGDPTLVVEVLHLLPGLRWYQSTWAGVEVLMRPGLRRDYLMTNARGVFGPLMSEFVFGYLLFIERRILERYQDQNNHLWNGKVTGSLRNKKLGLLGVGSIGAYIASTARHFGMQVKGYTKTSSSCVDVDEYFHEGELRKFITGLDYLVNCLPGTDETKGLVDASVLSWLPAHSVLINVGRGSSLDEQAVSEALFARQIAYAILDVFETEPLPFDHSFWNTPNLYITSHTAAPSFPSELAELFLENYQSFCDQRPLKYLVDFNKGY